MRNPHKPQTLSTHESVPQHVCARDSSRFEALQDPQIAKVIPPSTPSAPHAYRYKQGEMRASHLDFGVSESCPTPRRACVRLEYSSTALRCGNAEMQPKVPTLVPLALDRTTVESQSLYRTAHRRTGAPLRNIRKQHGQPRARRGRRLQR